MFKSNNVYPTVCVHLFQYNADTDDFDLYYLAILSKNRRTF